MARSTRREHVRAGVPAYAPQRPVQSRSAPEGDGWLHELAYEGLRVGCCVARGVVTLSAADGEQLTSRFREVVEAAAQLGVRAALLDGVVARVLPDGRTSASALAEALARGGPIDHLAYFAFDLLYLDGRDLRELGVEQRKAALADLLRATGGTGRTPLRFVEHFVGGGPRVFEHACKLGVGLLCKRRSAPHHSGRARSWVHVACSAAPRGGRAAGPSPAAASDPRRSVTHAQLPARRASGAERIAATGRSPQRAPARTHSVVVAGVAITTPERPVYPRLSFDKLALARFHERIADWLLPYVAERPLTLVRCERGVSRPDGLRSECRFLRHEPGWHRWAGPSLGRVSIPEQSKIGEYLFASTREALLALVQGDILELHCWNARVSALEQPDRIILDLDPGPDVAWPRVLEAAALVRRSLEGLGLSSWPKLTGGKGLHVVVPLRAEHRWDVVYRAALRVAERLVREHPRLFTIEFSRLRRSGRVLVDYKRNHRAAVAVAAFSPRAHPGGTVSVPVRWDELRSGLAADHYTVLNLPRRLERLREDPWRELWDCRQRLPRVLTSR